MSTPNNEIARKIIKDNIYMTIATADKSGEPWISPVVFGYDEDYNLYWMSDKNSKHSKLISQNNKVAIVIFDSKAPEGTGDGVYTVGRAAELLERELSKATKIHADRFGKEPTPIGKFLGESPMRYYKFTPDIFWKLQDPVLVKGQYVDYRVEVKPTEP